MPSHDKIMLNYISNRIQHLEKSNWPTGLVSSSVQLFGLRLSGRVHGLKQKRKKKKQFLGGRWGTWTEGLRQVRGG